MAWYQRSYFFNLLNKFNLKNFIFNFIFIFLICVLIDYNIIVDCSNIFIKIDRFSQFLKCYEYNGIIFRCSDDVGNYNAVKTIDSLLELIKNKSFNPNYNICKYFSEQKGVLSQFNKKHPYNHYNVCAGVFNGFTVNSQLTTKWMQSFRFLTEYNLLGNESIQFISKDIYIYSDELIPIFSNFNAIEYNKPYFELNSELIIREERFSLEYQNYINNYESYFLVNLLNSLNINN